ncbi:hypothetical protein [Idiomarina aminovorans]|uniref:hypothetical protein n=1 Tax=Idiomarina aminovorans TaxID=2914829 RepID=UPI002002CC38|nr:hypothetical protein [Idiomarina sp. ATCH4]MCK7459779.1 hypothetical protein [Idiomarina sp. ATCH4]
MKNVKIESAAGTLSAQHLANVHLNYQSSFNDDGPLLITQLARQPGKQHTLTFETSYLNLSESSLTFDFTPSEPIQNYQLMFIGAAQSNQRFQTSLSLDNQNIKVHSYGQSHPSLAGIIVVDSAMPISLEHQEALRLTIELYLRQKVSFVAELSANKATINLIDHSTVSYSALNSNASHSLINIKAFVQKNPESRTYLRFLIEMVGNSGTIDDRLLNGFVALEALLDDRTLQKDKVSKVLGVSQTTAESSSRFEINWFIKVRI